MATNLFKSNLYTIKALTNLHVGNGEANYSVIDKQVQRDPITNLPQINASSLKGALREYIENSIIQENNSDDNLAKAVATIVFGSEPTDNQKPKQGYVNFFDAKLLALPVRTDKEPFVMATSKEVLDAFIKTCAIYGIKASIESKENTFNKNGEYLVENDGWKYNTTELSFIGDKVVVLKDEHFRQIAKELPFVARNHLENGKSENLWYEEIVPRESLFYFVLQSPKENLLAYKQTKNTKDKMVAKRLQMFFNTIKESQLFIGANTTVGYGLCEIKAKVENVSYKEASDAE